MSTVSQTHSDFPIIGYGLRWKSDAASYDYFNNKTVASRAPGRNIILGSSRELSYLLYRYDESTLSKMHLEIQRMDFK
jgi:hypothetical protein